MAVIRYVGDGKNYPPIKVSVSMNNGRSWQEKNLMAGQSFPIPPNATNLLMDNVSYDPKKIMKSGKGKFARYSHEIH